MEHELPSLGGVNPAPSKPVLAQTDVHATIPTNLVASIEGENVPDFLAAAEAVRPSWEKAKRVE